MKNISIKFYFQIFETSYFRNFDVICAAKLKILSKKSPRKENILLFFNHADRYLLANFSKNSEVFTLLLPQTYILLIDGDYCIAEVFSLL